MVVDGDGHPVPAGDLAGWLRRVAPARAQGVVTIALATDKRVRRLNRRFRGIDRSTDVLSFPGGSTDSVADVKAERRSERSPVRLLGEILIATGVAKRQAQAVGHSYDTELRVLALHGLLHLLGFDHERDAGTMARIEYRLRRKGGLADGLIERAGRAG